MRPLAIAALVGSVVLGSCVGTARVPASVGGPALGARAEPDRIALLVGGLARPLKNGEDVPLSGPLTAAVNLRRLEGARGARLLVLRLRSGDTPVTDATVRVAAGMRFMDHGSFTAAAASTGEGAYIAPLQFAMPGEWIVTVAVETPQGTAATVEIELELLPD